MAGWSELWHYEFLGNELGQWAVALAIFFITFTVLPLVRGFISALRRRLHLKDRQGGFVALDLAAALVERTSRVFLLVLLTRTWRRSRQWLLFPGCTLT